MGCQRFEWASRHISMQKISHQLSIQGLDKCLPPGTQKRSYVTFAVQSRGCIRHHMEASINGGAPKQAPTYYDPGNGNSQKGPLIFGSRHIMHIRTWARPKKTSTFQAGSNPKNTAAQCEESKGGDGHGRRSLTKSLVALQYHPIHTLYTPLSGRLDSIKEA